MLSDGRHFSAVGDHLGANGSSQLFVYEPESKSLTRFMDVLSVIERPEGSWGFDKIHQMVVDRCQRIWQRPTGVRGQESENSRVTI